MDNRTEDLPPAETLAGDAERLLRVVEDDQGAHEEAARPADGMMKKRSPSKRPVRRRQRKSRGHRSQPPAASAGGRRASRPFPASTFEDALELAVAIQRISGGAKVRRLTLFEQLDKSPESGPSRQMITNSARYGLTTGSYKAEYLELTQLGRSATSTEGSARERLQARFELAINAIPPFQLLYETLKDRRIPTHAVMRDVLAEGGYSADLLQEAVETFIVNAKFIGLLRTIAGSERLISIEQLLDELPASTAGTFVSASPEVPLDSSGGVGAVDWATTCFYVAPIGEVESEIRQHSDVILAALVEPALGELGLKVVRADGIESPGVITKQVIEHIAKAKLVVADLSFHNPNVFYELALRHATGKPTIHLIRNSDRIPFDIDQFRTIRIDTSDLYAFVPQIETYRAEIATHARRALDETGEAVNPLFVFYPEFRSVLEAA